MTKIYIFLSSAEKDKRLDLLCIFWSTKYSQNIRLCKWVFRKNQDHTFLRQFLASNSIKIARQSLCNALQDGTCRFLTGLFNHRERS